MTSVYEVPPRKFIQSLATELKGKSKLKMPKWANFVKTGAHRERPPVQGNWWWTRQAALLRTLYKEKQAGVNTLRKKYGGKRRRGHRPKAFYKGSGKIIRSALQQLEKAGLVEKTESEGRKLTSQGLSLLNQVANKVENGSGRNKKKEAKGATKGKKSKSSGK